MNAVDEHAVAVIGVDAYNFQLTGGVAATLNASSCNSPTHSGPTVLVLNDQGGAVMHVTYDITEPLRAQMKHHEPIVLAAYGFKGGGRVREE